MNLSSSTQGAPVTVQLPKEKPDGSLEFTLRDSHITVQIVCNDISKESTDLIMHVINQDFVFRGGVAKSLIKEGGDSIVKECKAIGKPAFFSTHFTKPGKLAAREIAHVIVPASNKLPELKKCLDNFFHEISKKNIGKVSFSAIGAGAMGHSESQSVDLIFSCLSAFAESNNPSLRLVRIVIFENAKFVKFKDATKAFFASRIIPSSVPVKKSFDTPKPVKRAAGFGGTSIKIYSDERGNIDRAWAEFKEKMDQNIEEKTMKNDDLKKLTDRGSLSKLEHDFDVKIKDDKSRGEITIRGYNTDVANVQLEIRKILDDIISNERKG